MVKYSEALTLVKQNEILTLVKYSEALILVKQNEILALVKYSEAVTLLVSIVKIVERNTAHLGETLALAK